MTIDDRSVLGGDNCAEAVDATPTSTAEHNSARVGSFHSLLQRKSLHGCRCLLTITPSAKDSCNGQYDKTVTDPSLTENLGAVIYDRPPFFYLTPTDRRHVSTAVTVAQVDVRRRCRRRLTERCTMPSLSRRSSCGSPIAATAGV